MLRPLSHILHLNMFINTISKKQQMTEMVILNFLNKNGLPVLTEKKQTVKPSKPDKQRPWLQGPTQGMKQANLTPFQPWPTPALYFSM